MKARLAEQPRRSAGFLIRKKLASRDISIRGTHGTWRGPVKRSAIEHLHARDIKNENIGGNKGA